MIVKMKKNILRIILIILLGITFYIIFGFSSQDGESSGTISKIVTNIIINLNPFTNDLSNEEKIKIAEILHPIVRKLAHFSIYTVVGSLLMSLVSTYDINIRKRVIISLTGGFLYACTDEFHQTFTPGRNGDFKDVLIDTSGVILGIVLVYFILYIINKIASHLKSVHN